MIDIPGYKVHREIDHSDYFHSYSAIELSTGKTMLMSIFSHSAQQYADFKSVFNDIEEKIAYRTFGVISPIKEFVKTKDYTYIVSDLLSKSCAQVYKERAVDVKQLIQKIYQIAASIDLYHNVGFYHGGITLDNIYHDSNGDLTLGLAAFNQNFNAQASSHFDLQKDSYKAPEKEVNNSLSRDYYALGVVFYELVFKRNPFIKAKNSAQLDQLKLSAKIEMPDQDFAYLEPIFLAMLHPDPSQRLSSAKHLRTLCDQLGLNIKPVIYQIETLASQKKPQVSTESESSSTQSVKKPMTLIYAAALGVIVLALGVYFFFTSSSNDISPADNLVENGASTSVNQIPAKPSINSKTVEDISQFIQEAKQQINKSKMALALISINQALKIQADNKQALELKQFIENEIKINMLLNEAEKLVKSNNIVKPANNNALIVYRKVQAMLPQGDMRAIDGLKAISKNYFQRASRNYQQKQYVSAKKLIAEGLSIIPSDKALLQLQEKINKTQQAEQQAEKQRLALTAEKQRQEAQRQALLEQKQLEQIKLLEQQKLEEQQQAENQRLALVAEKQKQEEQQQQIDRIVKAAEDSLANDELSLDAITLAKNYSSSLNLLPTPESTKQALTKKITQSYETLAKTQLSKGQLHQAELTLLDGLSYAPDNKVLKGLKTEVASAQQEKTAKQQKAEQAKKAESEKRQALPIFGTF